MLLVIPAVFLFLFFCSSIFLSVFYDACFFGVGLDFCGHFSFAMVSLCRGRRPEGGGGVSVTSKKTGLRIQHGDGDTLLRSICTSPLILAFIITGVCPGESFALLLRILPPSFPLDFFLLSPPLATNTPLSPLPPLA